MVFVMALTLGTRRSVDGMVVIVSTAMMAISAPTATFIIPVVLYLFQDILVMVFVMENLMTRRSVDGMVVTVSTVMLAISAPTATSIIPIVLYLFQDILVMVFVTAILTTQRSADGMAVIVSKEIWCFILEKGDEWVKLARRSAAKTFH
jgi:hypothetical protein